MITSFENFQSKFIEEAIDNINDMEKALLELELLPNDKELIERVFRAMHSLKGGGAMFGFNRLSEFTHGMENIYDLVRSGKIPVTESLLSVTLKSVDLLKELLDTERAESPQILARIKQMTSAIDQMIRDEQAFALKTNQDFGSVEQEPAVDEMQMTTYYIHFYPGDDVLANGTNLLYLLDELRELGRLFAIPNLRKVPDLEELRPEQTYVYWDLFISTDKGEAALSDIFIFVEDESMLEIHKISGADLYENPQFVERLNELSLSQGSIELSEFTQFIPETVPSQGYCVDQQPSANPMPHEETRLRSASSIRVSSEKIDGLMNLVSELVITQERLNMIASRYQIADLKMVTENIQKLTGQLRDHAFSISLIPVESLLTRFQRLVRDLSGELGKQVAFTATGADTELDKTMIETLTDPLLHIIRNSIDHGIELSDERVKKGKAPCGTITLNAYYSGANVVIEVRDDGKGIDPKMIRKKAIEKGFLSEHEKLSDRELLQLIFLPGFSTASLVTEVSGRGVGMDVVKRNISSIRGEVTIESELGKGTAIIITLPLVLSIIDGLLVRIDRVLYVIPLTVAHRIYSVESHRLENNYLDLIDLDGRQVPFFNLRKELNLKGSVPAKSQLVVVANGDKEVALVVDQVVGKTQAVLKPLGVLFHRQKIISAATIMGDGTIALVFDINTIFQETINHI